MLQAQLANLSHLQEKWSPLLNHDGFEPFKDSHRRFVTSVLLENQEIALREQQAFDRGTLFESPTTFANAPGSGGGFTDAATAAGPVAGFSPVMISLIRRSMPNLIAYDLCGVQPLTGPAGLIFAMRSRYNNQTGPEAFYNEPDSTFSGQDSGFNLNAGFTNSSVGMGTTNGSALGTNPGLLNPVATASSTGYQVGQAMKTGDAEQLGYATGDQFNEMSFSIEKILVEAKSRALRAEYSLELAQDLKAIHGLSAEAELANILSTEILSEINREIIRTIYKTAEPGAAVNVATPGVFDLDVDSNGRWSVEKFKGLLFQMERDANAIAQRTRRGKGNIIMCSADVASALTMAGVLDYTPALNANLNVDDTGNLFAGVLQGKYRVFIDPYSANVSETQYYTIGYKGSSPWDAGLFYAPYIPLQMVRAVHQDSFVPRIGFKCRYGIKANPFAEGLNQGMGELNINSNRYYRRVAIRNLM
jgi:hypothetical protein